jgi:hypothetical protein
VEIKDLRQCLIEEYQTKTQKFSNKAYKKMKCNPKKQVKPSKQSLSMLKTTCLNHQNNNKKTKMDSKKSEQSP